MRKFTTKVIEQINEVYNKENFSGDNKELIMALFMQIFSYKYDDRIAKGIKFNNIQRITNKVWVSKIPNKTNEKVGIPYIYDEKEKNKFSSNDQNWRTTYILNKIRNCITHGSFEINDDGTITITDQENGVVKFDMTFEFICIVDVCIDIVQELNGNNFKIPQNISEKNKTIAIEKNEKIVELYDFLMFIMDLNKNSQEFNKSKIEYNYQNLKYPLILFNLLPMNENSFHNDKEFMEYIISLFPNKSFYVEGELNDVSSLKFDELYKVRNCIAHGQYYVNGNELVLYNLHCEEVFFVFDCLELNEAFEKINNKSSNVKR